MDARMSANGDMRPAANQSLTAGNWAILIVLAGSWSVSYLFNRINLTELPVLSSAMGRMGIATVALWLAVLVMRERIPREPAVWRGFVVLGILNSVLPPSLILAGQSIGVNSGLAAIMIGATPLFSVFMASLLVKDERLTLGRVGGIVLGIGGLTVLIGPAAFEGFTDTVAGQLLVVAAGLCYAIAAVYGRRFKGMSPLAISTGQLTCASVILVPTVAIVDQPWQYAPSLGVWGSLLGIGVISTAGAYLLYFRLLASAGATNTLLVTLLVPIGAMIWGFLFFREPVTFEMIAGTALIFLGLLVIDGRLLARLGRRTPAA
jgi:drug/metabolite transporter (DMT)-like permease